MAVSDRQVRVILKRIAESYGVSEPTNLTISQQREWIEELAPGFLDEASDLRPAQQRELIETFLPTSATGDVVHAAESVTESVGGSRISNISRRDRDRLLRQLAAEQLIDPELDISATGLTPSQRDEWIESLLPRTANQQEVEAIVESLDEEHVRAVRARNPRYADPLDVPTSRGPLRGDAARYQQFRRIAEEHGLEMSFLSQDYEARQVAAYRQASADVNDRIARLRGRIEELSSHGEVAERERWRLARETGLLGDIEGRIEELGGQTRTNIVEGWTEAGAMARSHMALEVEPLVEHINATSGTGGNLAQAVDFSKLDTTAIELGVGTAVADNVRLTLDMQHRLRQEIQAGLAAGLNVQRISGRVNDVMALGAERSEMITRWAMIKGNNLSRQASFEVMQQTVPQVKKQWLAQPDELTCPHCLAQHGTVIEVRESFDPENTYASTPIEPYDGFTLTPPLHPRCRCLIIAWHEAWRPYTEFPPEYAHEAARQRAISQGYWKALEADPARQIQRTSMVRRLRTGENFMRLRFPTPTGIVRGTFRVTATAYSTFQVAKMTYRGVRFVSRSRESWLAWAVQLARFEQFAADWLRGAGFNPVRGLIEEGLVVLDPRGQGGEFLTRLAPDEIRDWIGRLNEQAVFLDADEIAWRMEYDLRFLEVWELPRWVFERFRGEQAFRLRPDEVFSKLVTDDYVRSIEEQVSIVGEGGVPVVRLRVVGEELPTLEPTPLTVQERVAAAQQELVQEVVDELEAAAGALREADAIVARADAVGVSPAEDVTVIPFPGRDDVGAEVPDLTESGEVIRLIVGLRKFINRDWTNFAGLGIRARGPWTFSVDSFGRWVSYFRPRSYLRRSPTFFESTVSAAEEGIDEASDYISDEVWSLARTFFERLSDGSVTAEEVRLFISWQIDSNRQRARSSYRRMRGYVENLRNRLDVDWRVPDLTSPEAADGIGGITSKLFFQDPDGQRWLFKPQVTPGAALAEELGNRTAHALGLEAIPGSVTAVNEARLDGYAQRWIEEATSYRDELVGRTPWYRIRRMLTYVSDEELEQLQEFMILDWLIGNQDMHWEQFILRDDRLVHIDFGFSFLVQADISFSDFVELVPFLGVVRRQVGDRLDVRAVQRILARIEEMDQEDWLRRVREVNEGLLASVEESVRTQVIEDSMTAYRQKLATAREQVSEFYGSLVDDAERIRIQGLVGDEEGWYGRYLDRDLDWQRTQTGLPGEGQLRILRELTEGPESAQFPIWRDLPTVQARQTVRQARPHPDIVEGAVWDGYERFQRQIEFRVIADPEIVEDVGEIQAGAIWVLKEHVDAVDAQAEQMASEFFKSIGVPAQDVLATTRDEFENIIMRGFDSDGNWGALPFIWVDGPEGRMLTHFVWGDLVHMTLSQKELPPWYSFEDVWSYLVLDRDDLAEFGETLFIGFAGDVAAGADHELQIVVRSLFQNMVGDWLLMNTDLHTRKFRIKPNMARSVDRFRILWNNLAEGDGNISFKDYAEGLWGEDSNMAGARFYRELVRAYRAGRVRFDPDDLAPLVAQVERFDPSYYRRWLEDRWRAVNPGVEEIPDEVASRIDSALSRLENLRENLEEAFRAWGSEADPVWGGMWTPRWDRIRRVPVEAARLRSTANYVEKSITARRMGLDPSDSRLTIYEGLVEESDEVVRLRREGDRLRAFLDDSSIAEIRSQEEELGRLVSDGGDLDDILNAQVRLEDLYRARYLDADELNEFRTAADELLDIRRAIVVAAEPSDALRAAEDAALTRFEEAQRAIRDRGESGLTFLALEAQEVVNRVRAASQDVFRVREEVQRAIRDAEALGVSDLIFLENSVGRQAQDLLDRVRRDLSEAGVGELAGGVVREALIFAAETDHRSSIELQLLTREWLRRFRGLAGFTPDEYETLYPQYFAVLRFARRQAFVDTPGGRTLFDLVGDEALGVDIPDTLREIEYVEQVVGGAQRLHEEFIGRAGGSVRRNEIRAILQRERLRILEGAEDRRLELRDARRAGRRLERSDDPLRFSAGHPVVIRETRAEAEVLAARRQLEVLEGLLEDLPESSELRLLVDDLPDVGGITEEIAEIDDAIRRLLEEERISVGASRWVAYEQGHADAYAEQIAREFLAAAGVDVFPSHVVRREGVEYIASDFVEVGDTLPRISEPDDFRPVLFLFEDYPAGYQILNDMVDEGGARSVVHLGQELEEYGYEMFDQFLETMIWHWLLDVRSTPLGLHEIRRGGTLAAPVLTHPFASRARIVGPDARIVRTSFEEWLTESDNEFASSVWGELIDAYRAGDVDFNFDRVGGILSRIERMDRTEWKGKIRRFLELRARNLGRAELSEAELAYEGILLRRVRNIREDVTVAFRNLAEERGDDWVPIWTEPGVPGVPTNRMLPSARLRSVAPERWDEIRRAAENC